MIVSDGRVETSRYMSPLKIFEYMSSKRPIVCSNHGVLREVLNDDNAILVEPDSATAWIEAVGKLRDKRLRDKIAQKAYRDFVDHYTWKARANMVLLDTKACVE